MHSILCGKQEYFLSSSLPADISLGRSNPLKRLHKFIIVTRIARSFIHSMLDFYQKRKLKGILLLPITRIILFLIVVFLAYSAFVRYKIAAEMKERREQAEIEVQELEKQKRLLEKKVDYLSNERGIEAELRRQFDVTLPGEEVIVIMEPENQQTEPVAATSSEKERPWYVFWD